MIAARQSMIIVAAALLGSCASGDSLEGGRTVFNNPYAATVIDRTGIGPQCDVDIGRDTTCLDASVIQYRRGRNAVLRNGETVRLTRAQARLVRQRAELLEARRNQPPVPPPPPPPPPIAEDGSDKP